MGKMHFMLFSYIRWSNTKELLITKLLVTKKKQNTLFVLIIRYGKKTKDIETVQSILSSNLNNLQAKFLLHFENLCLLSF